MQVNDGCTVTGHAEPMFSTVHHPIHGSPDESPGLCRLFRQRQRPRCWKNSFARLSADGVDLAVIKHTHHDVDPDEIGRDSWRHRHAGARQVITGCRAAAHAD